VSKENPLQYDGAGNPRYRTEAGSQMDIVPLSCDFDDSCQPKARAMPL
jgi:hypothetical protein